MRCYLGEGSLASENELEFVHRPSMSGVSGAEKIQDNVSQSSKNVCTHKHSSTQRNRIQFIRLHAPNDTFQFFYLLC